jgi:hypothetical protein
MDSKLVLITMEDKAQIQPHGKTTRRKPSVEQLSRSDRGFLQLLASVSEHSEYTILERAQEMILMILEDEANLGGRRV